MQQERQEVELFTVSEVLDVLFEKWPGSDLKPEADFGKAIALTAYVEASGSSGKSQPLFKAFIESGLGHPVTDDAREVLTELTSRM